MRMQIRGDRGEVVCHGAIEDHLGFETALSCMRQLRRLDLEPVQHLLFDLTRATGIESAGVGLLLHAHERWSKGLQSTVIRCNRGPVHDILSTCRMERFYQIHLLD